MNEKIWQENIDFGRLDELTDKIIELAEDKLRVELPKSYTSILGQQNGGYIIYNAYPTNVPTLWADDHVKVDHIFGIGTGKEKGILESDYLIQEWGLPNDLVIISGDGHSWIALDYRACKANPPVILIEPETDVIIELARSFDTFLERLYVHNVEDDEDYSGDGQRQWTITEMKNAFADNDELEVGYALDYLYINPTKYKLFIEQSLIKLLHHPKLEIKQTAANYAFHFNENGILSSACVKNIVSILRKDVEIEDYADMYFKGL
ncbi:hypothetical protein JCM9140_2752 [Halalkalibacter wakoensis JCM 9140]|uniref:Knr4/Smi1-like domain-containing protein n=1 Tax=Halalkalibacter wakoensis JCM 9140 TaxID=1236970 RepID=W4Q3V9_9BACI|nr:SMI1/KNR4 family protein [Halalkalibacter wakoensis]GAE26667.1 hypothetical protein JCM9140_2752 [Halalkalibacter wakoensis JCM 9140]